MHFGPCQMHKGTQDQTRTELCGGVGVESHVTFVFAFLLGIGEAEVQLQTPDSASYITAGSDVILRCHLDASGDIRYEWFR